MSKSTQLHAEITCVLQTIDRLNAQIELHNRQSTVDILTVEGYQRLREQYFRQLEELFAALNIRADIHWQSV